MIVCSRGGAAASGEGAVAGAAGAAQALISQEMSNKMGINKYVRFFMASLLKGADERFQIGTKYLRTT
jgi:branched-subunit amino acid ABC-type transport system permease component